MHPRLHPTSLLAEARNVYDAHPALQHFAASAWRGGFASGAAWMREALALLRGSPVPVIEADFARLGLAKYSAAALGAILWFAGCLIVGWPVLGVFAIAVFYQIEAQAVFLFPLAIDGKTNLLQQSLRWTRRAGGTLRVMATILPIAVTMTFGGFRGGGFVRSWAVGCLAVCVWYERLRTSGAAAIHVRQEKITGWQLDRPVRLLYASDLHLGRPWSRRVPRQLLRAAREQRPDAILLGGDLVDCAAGLPDLEACVQRLVALAPVYAVAGNHDYRADIAAVQAAVERAGGVWLAHNTLTQGLPFQLESPDSLANYLRDPSPTVIPSGTPRRISDRPAPLGSPDSSPSTAWNDGSLNTQVWSTPARRVLCAHDPAIFPAALDAKVDLILAGHLHGGQCVLAERGGLLYPGAWWNRWTGLRFECRSTTMLISRGMADTLPLRWNCPKEVLLCEIS